MTGLTMSSQKPAIMKDAASSSIPACSLATLIAYVPFIFDVNYFEPVVVLSIRYRRRIRVNSSQVSKAHILYNVTHNLIGRAVIIIYYCTPHARD